MNRDDRYMKKTNQPFLYLAFSKFKNNAAQKHRFAFKAWFENEFVFLPVTYPSFDNDVIFPTLPLKFVIKQSFTSFNKVFFSLIFSRFKVYGKHLTLFKNYKDDKI